MDAYHEVLARLLEITEGRETKSTNLKDVVRKLGLHGNYSVIFERLSSEGWIAEDQKADFVRITHWGISEAKKANSSFDSAKPVSPKAEETAIIAHDLARLLEHFAKNASQENLAKIKSRLTDFEKSFELIIQEGLT